jgi:broad specificity phosphatase PhoE
MTLPLELVLVRHGESEGNIATRLAQSGDESAYSEAFVARHSSHWRLSSKGVRQARIAGEWLRERHPGGFDRWYVSEYDRAKETAALLDFQDASWFVDYNLRERDWGLLDTLPPSQRAQHAAAMAFQHVEPFFWTPPNGLSLAQLTLYLYRMLDTLHRECSTGRVVIVCHGEVMWTLRVILERMSMDRFRELHASRDPFDKIRNCQVLTYTRIAADGSITPYVNRRQSVCPWDLEGSDLSWHQVKPERYTNEQLMAQVAKWSHVVEGALD